MTMAGMVPSLTRAGAGDRLHYPKWITAKYYGPHTIVGGTIASQALGANTVYASPLWVPPGSAIDRIGINVTVVAAAGKILRLMLHASGANDLPGALLLDAGTILADALGDREITVSYTPPGGLTWISVVSDGTPTVAMYNNTAVLGIMGSTTVSGASTGSVFKSNVNANVPDPWGTPSGYLTTGHVSPGVRAV